ncbi:MAG TPA: PIG-L family deacetylase [Ilumatobacter sp.]|nr:PIG-L family deacetylase [Ilumatobacter sp.]
MGTLVCLHAHPDDEASSTAGTMSRAHAEGHRVVLVVATNGEHGEVPDDLGDQALADRRFDEVHKSAAIIGIDRVEWLGYRDSGMTGWDGNEHGESFWKTDVEVAAQRVADVLRSEQATVFTIYDWHGGYGHPDHIQVHRVGKRAAQLVADELPNLRVFESSMNRDSMRRQMAAAREAGLMTDEEDWNPDGPMDDGNPMGTPEAELTMAVDVTEFVGVKRAALAAHSSQITDTSFFLALPDEAFADAFGTEWFIEWGRPPGVEPGWMFDHV